MSQTISQPSVELHHCLRLTTNRSDVVGRRDFLRGISVAGLAAGTLSWTDLMMAQATELRKRGMACILLWMQGGPSQFETFSPKPDHPNGGPTKAISTAVPGIQIAENYPQVGQANGRHRDHPLDDQPRGEPSARHVLHAHRLYPQRQRQVSELRRGGGPRNRRPEKRSAVVRADRRPGQRSATTAASLGVNYDPFEMPNPGQMPNNTTLTTGVDRYQRRLDLLESSGAGFRRRRRRDEVENHQKQYDRAAQLILSPKMKTFDLGQETDAMREAYGKTKFGSGCLLARRLVEAGVTFIEINLDGWDTHADNFRRTTELAGQVDQPLAQLIADLKQRGLFDSTVIMWMGEFGRTPTDQSSRRPRSFPQGLQRARGRRRHPRRPGDRRDRQVGQRSHRARRERPRSVSDRLQEAEDQRRQGKHEPHRPTHQDRRRRPADQRIGRLESKPVPPARISSAACQKKAAGTDTATVPAALFLLGRAERSAHHAATNWRLTLSREAVSALSVSLYQFHQCGGAATMEGADGNLI